MEIVTREQAKSLGLTRYFTGKPCKRGHICERQIRGNCLECVKLRYNIWINKNDRHSYMSEWRGNNAEHKKSYDGQWRKDNPDYGKEYYRYNSDKIKESTKKWQNANPAKYRAIVNLRQKRLLMATPKWTNKVEYVKVFELKPDGYHVDHIVPIKGITPEGYKVSGLNVPWNLQYLTASENYSKHNRMSQRCYEIACSLKK